MSAKTRKPGPEVSVDAREPEPEDPRGDDLPTIYSNNLHLRVTQWDFELRFGQITDVEGDQLRVRQMVRVYMSPQHIKVVAGLLTSQVENYERLFGPIPERQEAEVAKEEAGDD